MSLLPPGVDYETPNRFEESRFDHYPASHLAVFGKTDSGKTSAWLQALLRRDFPYIGGFGEIHGFTGKAKRGIGSVWELMLDDPLYNKKFFTHRTWTDKTQLDLFKNRVKGTKPFMLVFDDQQNKLLSKGYSELRSRFFSIRNYGDEYCIVVVIAQNFKGHKVGVPKEIRSQLKMMIIFGNDVAMVSEMIDDKFIITDDKAAFVAMYQGATPG
jgi:hypothetical protein